MSQPVVYPEEESAKLDRDDPCFISFKGNGWKLDTAEDAQKMVTAINNCPNLHTLELEGNTLGIPASEAIAKCLEDKMDLKRALFKDIFTTRLRTEVPQAVEFLAQGLSLSGCVLNELDLSDNAFGPIGMEALAPFLRSDSCRNLEALRLNNNGLGIGGGTILSTCLPSLTKLKVLICGRNRLENEASTAIGKSLRHLSTIEVLEMPQNGIRFPGIQAIADALENNPGIRILNLNDNIFTEKGGAAMNSALRQATNIQVINFGDCLLRTRGGIAVVKAILESGCKSLKELILGGNELGGEQLFQLLLSFKKLDNSELTIDLSNNNFGRFADRLIEQFDSANVTLILEDDEGTEDEVENSEDENVAEDSIGSSVGEGDEPEVEKKLQESKKPLEIPKFHDGLVDLLQNVCLDEKVEKETMSHSVVHPEEESGKLDRGDPCFVSFKGNGWKLDTAEDALKMVAAINNCPHLHTLELEGNTLGIPASETIAKCLEDKMDLKRALFKDIFTTRLKTEVPQAVEFLAQGLSLSGCVLNELDLSDNAFGPIGMEALAPFLQSDSCRNLEVLRLNNNGLGIGGGTILSTCLPSLTKLKVLICGRNRLENEGSTAIGKSLRHLSTIEVLEMPQNGIRFPGIQAIADALENNPGIRILNLNDNIFTEKGGAAMSTILRQSTCFQIINFGDCLLRTQGGIAVVKAILESGCKSLKELILSGNELGGEQLFQLLLSFKKLDDSQLTIDLSNNNFGRFADRLIEQFDSSNLTLILEDDEGTEDEDENYEDEKYKRGNML